jgi:MarC family membrane protein
MSDSFFHAFILLFLVTDPVGNIPLFVSVLSDVSPKRRWKIVVRECIIAFVLLLMFMLLGRHFLAAIQLSEISLRIGGGVVLFLIALRMIFPQPGGIMGDNGSGAEPFIVPLAIPALAGPSALATVLLFSSGTRTELTVHIGALFTVAIVWLVILLAADRLQAALGIRVMKAFERLMGLILTAIAVEMLLAGIRDYIASF